MLTSPLAFLFAGILELGALAAGTIGRRVGSLTDRMLGALSNIARR